jgi:hypothetical protein
MVTKMKLTKEHNLILSQKINPIVQQNGNNALGLKPTIADGLNELKTSDTIYSLNKRESSCGKESRFLLFQTKKAFLFNLTKHNCFNMAGWGNEPSLLPFHTHLRERVLN